MTSPAITAFTDQITAASREAGTALRTLAHALPGAEVAHHPGDPWLRQQLHDLEERFGALAVRSCVHAAAGPCVLYAVAWRPQHVTCLPCAPLLAPDPVEDTTCDRCRRRVDHLHAGLVHAGPVLFGYGLCTPCHNLTDRPRR